MLKIPGLLLAKQNNGCYNRYTTSMNNGYRKYIFSILEMNIKDVFIILFSMIWPLYLVVILLEGCVKYGINRSYPG